MPGTNLIYSNNFGSLQFLISLFLPFELNITDDFSCLYKKNDLLKILYVVIFFPLKKIEASANLTFLLNLLLYIILIFDGLKSFLKKNKLIGSKILKIITRITLNFFAICFIK